MRHLGCVVVCCLVLAAAAPAWAQTREKGPWWPHSLWGAEDQAGASNWITPEKVLQAVGLVRYNDSPAGIGLEVAGWVVARQLTMIGSDSWTSEVVPNPDPNLVFPVHQELMNKNGIFNLENLKLEELASAGTYEFLFVFTPVPLKGATGSPGRPIAIR